MLLHPRFASNPLAQVLRFFRISDWYYFEGFAVLGFLLALRNGAHLSFTIALLSIIDAGFALAYAFSLNNCFDVEIDRKTGVRTVLTEGGLSSRSGLALALSALVMMLLVQVLGLQQSTGYSLLFIILWTAYSVPPIRLKSKPVVGTLANGVGFALLFLMGYSALGQVSQPALFFFGFLTLIEIPSQLFHEMAHHQWDDLGGARTTAVRFGVRASAAVGAASMVASALVITLMFALGQLSVWYLVVVSSFAAFCLGLIYEYGKSGRTANEAMRVRKYFKWGGMLIGGVFALFLALGL